MLLLIVWSGTLSLNAASFRGQVIDAETGFPIERAKITIDEQFVNPPPESTSLFGFFEFTPLPAGDHVFKVTRGGYAPVNEILLLGAEDSERVIELTPLSQGFFDVSGKVACVMTGLPIPGAILTATKIDINGQPSGGSVDPANSDGTGFAMLQGLEPGRYTFQVQPPVGWQVHQGSSVGVIQTDQSLTFLLKPNQGDLSVNVSGYDPAEEAIGALKDVIIEVTGLDPYQLISPQSPEIVPIRSSVTTEEGSVAFKELPLIAPYRLVVKKYGYTKFETILPVGNLGIVNVQLELLPFELQVDLIQDVYALGDVFTETVVTLEGIKDSHTEGILRSLAGEEAPESRLFAQLLPGRYRLHAHGEGALPTHDIRPIFRGQDYVEIHLEGLTEFELDMQVLMSRIYGRIMAADTKALPPTLPVDEVFAARPKYQSKQVQGVKWIAAEEDQWLDQRISMIPAN